MTKGKFKLGQDERGAVLVPFTIYLVAIMGMIGLALDGARLILVNNSLQDLADAAALAAAAQLDGAQDALTRADTAARSLTTNTPTRWYNVAGAAIQSGTNGVQFYSSLSPDTTTTDPKTANYVKVTTGGWQVAPTFLSGAAALSGSTASSNSTSSTAWAQGNGATNGTANCGVTQSFFCNPFEGTALNPGNANNFAQNMSVGTMMRLVNDAGAAGNWGLIQVPGENANPHNQAAFWAQPTAGGSCVTADSQGTTRTGNVGKFAYQGMNVRFDSPFGSGDELLSAPIVINGFRSAGGGGPSKLIGNNCNRLDPGLTWDPNNAPCPNGAQCSGEPVVPCFDGSQNSWGGENRTSANCPVGGFKQTNTDATSYQNYQTACNLPSSDPGFGSCPLPRDRTFTSNRGNGLTLADLQAYWKNHHGTSTLPAGVNSRWKAYQCELGIGPFAGVAGCPPSWQTDSVEPHGPVCTASTVGTAHRRILSTAVVDCSYWGTTGNKPLPTTTLIAQFFMTEPAGQGTTTPSSNGMIYAEYVGCFTDNPASDPSGNCIRGSEAGSAGLVNPGLYKNLQLVR